MIFIMQAVRIYEMSVCAAERSGIIIHHLNEIFRSAAYVFSQNLCCIAGGVNHREIKQLLNSERFAHLKICNLRAVPSSESTQPGKRCGCIKVFNVFEG